MESCPRDGKESWARSAKLSLRKIVNQGGEMLEKKRANEENESYMLEDGS